MAKHKFSTGSFTTLLVLGVLASTPALASTKIGYGMGMLQAYKKSTSEDNKLSHGEIRLSLEHELNDLWSAEVTANLNSAFSFYGIYGKYRFSPEPASFYAKAGPIRYSRTHYDGNSALIAAGWQYVGESNWGFAAETYASRAKNKDIYGLTLSVTYSFHWFD